MKKIFTSLFTLVFVGGLSLFAQAPRTVLIEEFTSATCPPCAATNPIFRKFLEQFGNKVVNVAFQCQIPSTGDPMYAHPTQQMLIPEKPIMVLTQLQIVVWMEKLRLEPTHIRFL